MVSGKTPGRREAAAYARGETVEVKEHHRVVANAVDVSAIRQKLGLTRREFALKFGFSLGTLRHWQQDSDCLMVLLAFC